jgi:hypothetical protein
MSQELKDYLKSEIAFARERQSYADTKEATMLLGAKIIALIRVQQKIIQLESICIEQIDSPKVLTSFDGVKAGTKLKIRKDLKVGNKFELIVTDDMADYAGKTVIARKLAMSGYVVLTDSNFEWSCDMFKCVVSDADELHTISKEDFVSAIEDYDVCTHWKTKLIYWVVNAGEYSFTIDQINEMKKAGSEENLELIDSLFPHLKEEKELTIPELMAKLIIQFGSTAFTESQYAGMIKQNNDTFYVAGSASNAAYSVGMHFLLAHIDKSCYFNIAFTQPCADPENWFSIYVKEEKLFKDFLKSLLTE